MTAKLYCESHPHLADRDILFIHGNLASTAWWQPLLGEWKRTGSKGPGRLLMADWRGCGQNDEWPADQTFSIEDLARDFLALLDEKGVKTAGLVGHSLGGLIALQMMILAPGRFSKAVLLDPVGARGVVFDDSMYDAFRMMAGSRDLTGTVILSTVHHNDRVDEALKRKLVDDAFKAVRGIGTSVLEILKSVDLSEDALHVKVPTLILHGEHDQIIPIKDSEQLARLMPKAKLEPLKDAGHCWNIEDPEAFTRRVKEWFT